MNNPFMLPEAEYVRDQNILAQYVKVAATRRARAKGISYEEAEVFVKSKIGPGKQFEIKSPEFQYAFSETRGNKELGETTLWDYVTDVVDKDYLMAPTLTSYYPLDDFVTQTVPFLEDQSKKRNILKDIKFQAKLDGDEEKMGSADAGQNTVKRYMNSVSGAYTVMSTTLFNFTGHSSLTSTCRVGTSYANASNERFIGGMRHYHNVDVTINALFTTITLADLEKVAAVTAKYQLHIPTIADTMACISRSTKRAFRSTAGMLEIQKVVETMTDAERTSFVYTSDYYHLYKHNKEFAQGFIKAHYATPYHQVTTRDEAFAEIKLLDGETFILACYLSGIEIKGVKFKDIEEKDHLLPLHCKVASIGKHITKHLNDHADLIDALFKPKTLPASIYKLPSMVRYSAVYSDTDSTLSTGQHYVMDISPDNYFSEEAWNVGYVMSFLACQQLPHLHAMMSANLGIKGKDRFKFSMKNEYYIPLILLTGRVKNYAYLASAQEGNVLKDMDFTLKGVSLRGISSSKLVADEFEKYVRYIFDKIMNDGGLTIEEVFMPVLDVYNKIVEDIRNNGYSYLRSAEVKEASTYKKGEDDPNIKNLRLWEEVFAPTYGDAPEIPYQSLSISVEIRNKAKLDLWVEEMTNKDLGERMKDFVMNKMGGKMTTIRIPAQPIITSGVPEEIMSVIDLRKLTTTIMLPFYIILEGLGVYFVNDKLTRIINDEYVPIQA